MVSNFNPGRAALADALRAFTQRKLRQEVAPGEVQVRQPSLRSIERATGIPHQRLSDFLRNPEKATAALVSRVEAALADPRAAIEYRGRQVTYVDAPIFSRGVLENLRIPDGAQAFRVITGTEEASYNGYRSTEWTGELDSLAQLGAAVPGGYANISRIVFYVGED